MLRQKHRKYWLLHFLSRLTFYLSAGPVADIFTIRIDLRIWSNLICPPLPPSPCHFYLSPPPQLWVFKHHFSASNQNDFCNQNDLVKRQVRSSHCCFWTSQSMNPQQCLEWIPNFTQESTRMVHPSSPSILALISSFSPQVYSTWVHMAYFSLPSAHKTPSGPRAVGSWVLCLNPLPSGLPKPHFCSSFRSRDAFMSSIFKSHPNFLSPTWVLFFRILVNIWIYITYLLAYLSGYRHMHMHTYISMQINNRGTDINRNPLPFLLEYKFLKERWEFGCLVHSCFSRSRAVSNPVYAP